MAVVKNLMVRSGADFSALYKEMNNAQKRMNSFQKGMKKALAGLGAVLGGLAVGELIKDSIRVAMDVQGSMLQIQRTMGANATVFENWAQTQAKAYGMAREEAYKYGATYSNLISSFVQDTQETTRYTIELLQASSVVAEKTGRNVEDVMERIRSGLLGNTEAIEDLGIHVNIAMLESTEAFRLFARGRSWKQLTFQEQQQIRLLSILEQAYVKYGDTLAGTVHTKQLMFIATLKNIRLNFGQAFLPVYDTILPILTDLANTLEASKETLQRWGQSIAGVVRTVVKGFSLITGAIVKNWQAIKFVGTTLLTYVAITKGVAAATTAWRLATLALKGELMTKVPVLTAVSTAIGTYRLQMALAPVATNIFSAALYRLQAALYAVQAALGPIGWAILGISAAVGVGVHLWGKYTQSVYSGAKVHDELAEGIDQVEGSAGGAAGAIEDEADALTEAGKAAGKNIQSFDEVHQLQEDMAGSAEDLAKNLDYGTPEIGDFEIPDIGAQLEQIKPTLAGFWEWIKQEAGNLWETVKQKWSDFVNWVKSWAVWDWLGQKWQALKDVTITVWNAIATTISNVWNWLSGLVSGIFGPIGEFISTTWNNLLETTTTIWNTIWTTLSTIWNDLLSTSSTIFGAIWTFISDTWNNLWATVSTVWNLIWTFLSGLWNNIWATAGTIWKAIADLITGKIDLRTAVAIIWNAIVTFFTATWQSIRSTASGIWEAIAGFIIGTWEGLKTAAETIWNAIATFFSNTWNNLKNAVEVIWNAIRTFFITTWENLKETALTVWQTIEQYIVDPIRRVWDGLKEIWSDIKTLILDKWDEIREGISNRAQPLINAVKEPFIKAKEWILGLIREAKEWGKNLVNSIIDGIRSTAGRVRNAILDIFSGFSGGGGYGGGGRGGGKSEEAGASSGVFHDGGWVGTSGSRKFDEVMALLQTGEFVVSRKMIENIEGVETYNPISSGISVEQIEQAMYRAFINAMRVVQASSNQGDTREIVLKIDNTVLARMQLPAIIREGQRQGLDLVVRPQGV